jgi:hypothetical protein
MKRTAAVLWSAMLLLPGLTGCGVELVGGAERGEVETTMTDDPSSNEPSPSRSPAPSMSRAPEVSEQVVAIEGTVSADLAVALVAGGEATQVTSGTVTGQVRIASTDRDALGTRRVVEGVYPTVRLTFTRIEAQVETGVGAPLSVEVDMRGSPLVIEAPVPVEVREEDVATVEVDLNAAVWLAFADPVTGLVPRSAFASAIAVRTGRR